MIKSFLKKIIRIIASWVMYVQKRFLPKQILAAYQKGKFPMMGRFGFLEWQSPKKRTIIPFDERFHIERELRRIIRKNIFDVTFDTAFREVIEACAETKPERGDAWLSSTLIDAYSQLHKSGYAHSVEIWHDGNLVGGMYGVTIGGFFSGESTFHRKSNAGKVGMVYLVEHLRKQGFVLHDAQFPSSLSNMFGGYEIQRDEYMKRLTEAIQLNVKF